MEAGAEAREEGVAVAVSVVAGCGDRESSDWLTADNSLRKDML
jgi:hypothetical protein